MTKALRHSDLNPPGVASRGLFEEELCRIAVLANAHAPLMAVTAPSGVASPTNVQMSPRLPEMIGNTVVIGLSF